MIVTVFRSRLIEESREEYLKTAARMNELAVQMPGYVSHKVFVAPDGERVTIVEFETQASHDAWAKHGEHVDAKKTGRKSYYSEYKLQVCEVTRSSEFRAGS